MSSGAISPLAVSVFIAVAACFVVEGSAFVNIPGCLQRPEATNPLFRSISGLYARSHYHNSARTLRASSQDSGDTAEDIAAKALRAKEEAEKAAQRASAIKKVANQKQEAENAALKAAALRKFIPKEQPSTQTENEPDNDSETESDTPPPSSETKRRFDRQFFEVTLDKPMGLVLEENHESLQGAFVADVVSGSNAAKAKQDVVGCQLVSFRAGEEGDDDAAGGFDAMGLPLDDIIAGIADAPSPVTVKLFRGSSSSLYGGWNAEAKGKEVTIATNLPNKQLIDRIRSGL